jgi:hypothetical protein
MMLDWNQYREQLLKAIGDLGRLSPQTVRGSFFTWRSPVATTQHGLLKGCLHRHVRQRWP